MRARDGDGDRERAERVRLAAERRGRAAHRVRHVPLGVRARGLAQPDADDDQRERDPLGRHGNTSARVITLNEEERGDVR